MMPADYRRSLKLPEAEEFFDLLVYRPLGYLLVRLMYRTPISPNQVTAFSTLFGIAAAFLFALGSEGAAATAGVLYCIANILDCADGQLARLQNSGTLLGRVVDGVGDYISSAAIFFGLGVGLSASGSSAWLLVIAAGASTALHAMLFDHYQGAFIVAVSNGKRSPEEEQKLYADEITRLKSIGGSFVKLLMLKLYLWYIRVQQSGLRRVHAPVVSPAAYKEAHRGTIRCWSVLGPTTNRTALIACALAGHLELYLWLVVIAGNCWIPVCALYQRRVHHRLAALTS